MESIAYSGGSSPRFGISIYSEIIMKIDVKQDCIGIDWMAVSETLKCVGMAYFKKSESMRECGFTE